VKKASEYYKSNKPVENVLSFLESKYGEREDYTVEELSVIDSFHIRGKAATVSLATVSQIQKNALVLDIGAGPGGTARYLSSTYGANVIGLDLTSDFSVLASTLSKKTLLAEKNSFLCGNAVALPFKNNSFDNVWMEHVQMNIENKLLLLKELYRVLKQGGCLSLYEVFQTDTIPPDYPLPWADVSDSGFLISPGVMKAFSEEAGFEISHWHDSYDEIVKWAVKSSGKEKDFKKAAPGVYSLMGTCPQQKVENFTTAVLNNRIAVVEAVLKK